MKRKTHKQRTATKSDASKTQENKYAKQTNKRTKI